MAILVALTAWVTVCASIYYTTRLNPEVRYFKRIRQTQQVWGTEVRTSGVPVIAIAGGSGTGASIRAKEASASLGVPVLNLGLGAGMGARVIGEAALESVRKGDTLVLMLEPSLLSGDMAPPPLGIQFAWSMGKPAWLGLGNRWTRWMSTTLQLRPGARHLTSLLVKLAIRRPLYRYQENQIERDGSVLMREARDFGGEESALFKLSPGGASWLEEMRRRGEEAGVRCVYTLPMIYCDPAQAAVRREHLVAFLDAVRTHLPVLATPGLGINTNRAEFSDTPYHPFPAATVAFTEELVRAAKAVSGPSPAATPEPRAATAGTHAGAGR
ncbi:MAG: hypothetical protein IT580_05805 [Verrucomicrobiales bacterium]|nr:hypothetical protein [Verrucomicrobiales bacterium]